MVTLNDDQPGQAPSGQALLRKRSRESSVRGQVYRLLLRDIEQCVARPGDPLSEKDAAARLGVSRTPVREAFLQLAEEGLIVISPQRGTAVAKISARQVRQAQFAREVLERAILAVACQGQAGAGLPGEDYTPLDVALDAQRRAAAQRDYAAFYEADRVFHAEIARLSGFDGAGRLAGGARVHLNRVRWLSLPEPPGLGAIIAEHAEIAAAVKAGDAGRGDRALTSHLRGVLGALPDIAGRFSDYFDHEEDGLAALPDTSGLSIGWKLG